MTDPNVFDWNGNDLPPELARLPPGRYRIERIEGPADEPDDDVATPDQPDPSGPGDADVTASSRRR